MKPNDFITHIAPIAITLRLEGSPIFPSVRIAQAAHETGWTIHDWNNLVGYKVGSGKLTPYWHGKSISTKTWEVYDGVRHDHVTANWRVYDSIEDCFRDQDLLFANARYKRVREATTPFIQTQMLRVCGYATDPAYTSKLNRYINQYQLTQYDEEVSDMLNNLQSNITNLESRLSKLESQASMPVPDWAKEAVDKAVQGDILLEPNGSSYDLYRVLTVLNRKGLL
jgi:flagellum-specific peptidoglycan hydrolase FlgJ